MTVPNISGVETISVQMQIPGNLLGTLTQIRHAKKMTDDALACTCVLFCLRLVLDSQIEAGEKTPLTDDLNRALLDVRGERRILLDVISGAEKALADGRALMAALTTRAES